MSDLDPWTTLTNEIDPLWRRQNLILHTGVVLRNNNRYFETLRLATKLLEHTEEYFVHVLCATRLPHPRFGGTAWLLDPSYKITHSNTQTYREAMQRISQKLRIYIGPDDTLPHFALTVTLGSPSGTKDYIQISHAYTRFFQHPNYDNFDKGLQQRIAFMLAVTLVHEHAHCILHSRIWRQHLYSTHPIPEAIYKSLFGVPEPYLRAEDPIRSNEVGWMWERWAFGGTPAFMSWDGRTDTSMNIRDLTGELGIHYRESFPTAPRLDKLDGDSVGDWLVNVCFDGGYWLEYDRLERIGVIDKNIHDTWRSNVLVAMLAAAEGMGTYPTSWSTDRAYMKKWWKKRLVDARKSKPL